MSMTPKASRLPAVLSGRTTRIHPSRRLLTMHRQVAEAQLMQKAACCVLVATKAMLSLTLCSSLCQLQLVVASRIPERLTMLMWSHAVSVSQGSLGLHARRSLHITTWTCWPTVCRSAASCGKCCVPKQQLRKTCPASWVAAGKLLTAGRFRLLQATMQVLPLSCSLQHASNA